MERYILTSPVRLEPETKERIDRIAVEERRTRCAVMRMLIEDGLKFRGLTPPAQNARPSQNQQTAAQS